MFTYTDVLSRVIKGKNPWPYDVVMSICAIFPHIPYPWTLISHSLKALFATSIQPSSQAFIVTRLTKGGGYHPCEIEIETPRYI